uniref:(northern house mosquito) hypothetical protein n=1 Tax=Culex pipiens TaxID=7175 RepID=A0A8D8EA93_CULPI
MEIKRCKKGEDFYPSKIDSEESERSFTIMKPRWSSHLPTGRNKRRSYEKSQSQSDQAVWNTSLLPKQGWWKTPVWRRAICSWPQDFPCKRVEDVGTARIVVLLRNPSYPKP